MPDDVIISADSHMTEPPDLWVERIDRGFRDRAPRVVREHQGKPGHWFVCEGLEPRSVAGTFAAGKTPEELAAFQKVGYEAARPGGWDPAERLKDMDLDGVEADVIYTTLGFRQFWLTDAALVPFFLQKLDQAQEEYRYLYPAPLKLTPSEYFRRQVFATFIDDPVGVATREFIGAANIMWSSDYPHTVSTWPHSREVVERDFLDTAVPEVDDPVLGQTGAGVESALEIAVELEGGLGHLHDQRGMRGVGLDEVDRLTAHHGEVRFGF